ncbi:tetratricopeptide repeat protein 19 homolog, mitochondrial [Schistocerca gregaria]|uniref:tetratricopeptide repeat protein 19 homolog, mitochondrial n=1 Tax=Schistocerca gregaria TaxID=7010 RepID=UPI00211EB891|nr:tetratricopeptide repeat protein 19 homolog, mitochondrial [Schistocerca gregaria]
MYRLTRIAFQVERKWLSSSKLCKKRFNASRRDYSTKLNTSFVTEHEYRNRSENFPSLLVWGGVFSFLQSKEEPELIQTIKRAILLMQKDEMKKAEQMLHIALKLAQEQQNEDGIVYVLDLMANLAYDMNEHDKAHKLFVSVMQHLFRKGVQQDDNKIIHISLKLADNYHKQGEKRKAEEGFKFCLENLENKLNSGVKDEDTLLLLAMTLDWYAQFVFKSGRYKDAQNLMKRAYDLSVSINGETSEQVVVLLNDLGTVSCLQGDLDAALKYLKQATAIGEKFPDMLELGSIYINLGFVYLKKQMFDEAKRACVYAREQGRRLKNKEVEDVAELCLQKIKLPEKV